MILGIIALDQQVVTITSPFNDPIAKLLRFVVEVKNSNAQLMCGMVTAHINSRSFASYAIAYARALLYML